MSKRTPIVAPQYNGDKGIAGDGNVGQLPKVNIPVTGDARKEPEGDIEIIRAEALKKEKLDNLAFMEQQLEIIILPTTDKLASPIVELWVNSIPQRLVRNRKQLVKRKYVEVLARAKPVSYDGRVHRDPDGEVHNQMIPTSNLQHPFQVLHDPAGARGAAWLQEVLAQAE